MNIDSFGTFFDSKVDERGPNDILEMTFRQRLASYVLSCMQAKGLAWEIYPIACPYSRTRTCVLDEEHELIEVMSPVIQSQSSSSYFSRKGWGRREPLGQRAHLIPVREAAAVGLSIWNAGDGTRTLSLKDPG